MRLHPVVLGIVALVVVATPAAALEVEIVLEAPASLPLPVALPLVGASTPAAVEARASTRDAPAALAPALDAAPLPPRTIVLLDLPRAPLLDDAAPAPAPARAPAPAAAPAPLERVYVGHDEAAPDASAGLALTAGAAVAAAGAAGATASPWWARLRRFAPALWLYTRIARERLLDHDARDKLLAVVRERPGIAMADLAAASSLPRNTAVYHARRLEKEGLVSSTRQGRARLYFAPGALDRLRRADALAALRHPLTHDIAASVYASPGLDQRALCDRFGLQPSLAHWHAARLVSAGVVEKRREGRHVRYYPLQDADLIRPLGA